MKVWLLKDGENLPVQPGAGRMRTWMLAEAAAEAGHEVTWWSSTHSHQRKELLFDKDHTESVGGRFVLRLINAGAYSSNRSLKRVQHHRRLARRFKQLAEKETPPDVIVASYPIIGYAQAAIDYARGKGIPVVVDIRDPWPDVFRTLFPSSLSFFGELVVKWFDRDAKRCLSSSTGIVAVSKGFLSWAQQKAGLAPREYDRVFYIGGRALDVDAAVPKRNQVLSEYGDLSGKTIITFVGSFGYSYQLELIGDLARRLHKEGNEQIHFALIGDGMQRELVENYSKELPNVSYLGWQDAKTVQDVLAVSDVGIAPYNVLPGCMPNKVCEYLAAGLPVLNSTFGDLPPLLEEFGAGFSYAPDDLDVLHGHVMKLCNEPDLVNSLAAGAHRLYTDRFVAETIYAEYVSYLEELAKVGRS